MSVRQTLFVAFLISLSLSLPSCATPSGEQAAVEAASRAWLTAVSSREIETALSLSQEHSRRYLLIAHRFGWLSMIQGEMTLKSPVVVRGDRASAPVDIQIEGEVQRHRVFLALVGDTWLVDAEQTFAPAFYAIEIAWITWFERIADHVSNQRQYTPYARVAELKDGESIEVLQFTVTRVGTHAGPSRSVPLYLVSPTDFDFMPFSVAVRGTGPFFAIAWYRFLGDAAPKTWPTDQELAEDWIQCGDQI